MTRRHISAVAASAITVFGVAIGLGAAPGLRVINPADFSAPLTQTTELSVKYEGKRVQQVELWIDGKLFAQKSLDTPLDSGISSFLIDPAYLAPGTHTATVKVRQANGEATVSRVKIAVDGPATENLPLRVIAPASGEEVQGKVRINVDVADHLGKPYVSIYVDRKFKVLRNYPPYQYVWDTTGLPNGSHLIEALAVDQAQNVFRAAPIRVFVNNPGGRTSTDSDWIEVTESSTTLPIAEVALAHTEPAATPARVAGIIGDVRASEPGPAQVAAEQWARTAPAAPVVAMAIPGFTNPTPLVIPVVRGAEPANHIAALVSVSQPTAVATIAMRPSDAVSIISDRLNTPADRNQTPMATAHVDVTPAPQAPPTLVPNTASVTAADREGEPVAVYAALASEPAVTPAAALVQPATIQPSAGVITREPDAPKMAQAPQVYSKADEPFEEAAPAQAASAPSKASGIRKSVVMNGNKVPSDTAPQRIQGIPFAPFRPVFEAMGGSVSWMPQNRTVHAQDSARGRTVKFKVGQKQATVDGQFVVMERASTIRNSRAMVPASFLQKALKLGKVHYDPKTGNLLLESED